MTESLPKSIDEMTDIIDIEGILTSSLPDILRTILYAVLILIVVFILYKIFKKLYVSYKNKKAILSPRDRALKGLEALIKNDLFAKGNSTSYYFLLDEIFRRFLFEEYHCDVLDRTFEELKTNLYVFLPIIKQQEWDKLVEYLGRAQMVKFAKIPANERLAKLDFDYVKSIIQKNIESD